jgi:hypothetical protein
VNDLSRKRAELLRPRDVAGRVERQQAMLVKFRALLPVVDAIRNDRGLLFVFSLPARGIVATDPAWISQPR